MFSRVGRNTSARLKILKDPMKVFTERNISKRTSRKIVIEQSSRLNTTQILDFSTTPTNKAKNTPSPTSSFLATSRETWYNPYVNKDLYSIFHSSPKFKSKTPTAKLKITLPLIQNINSKIKDLKLRTSIKLSDKSEKSKKVLRESQV